MPGTEFSDEQTLLLIDSACNVVNNWETNHLARAVNQMRQALMDLGCVTDEQGHISIRKN